VRDQWGALRSALGYSVRQVGALRAFLHDGRLRMDNDLFEGQPRKVVRIRDASIFAGSDEHAEAAGLIASASSIPRATSAVPSAPGLTGRGIASASSRPHTESPPALPSSGMSSTPSS